MIEMGNSRHNYHTYDILQMVDLRNHDGNILRIFFWNNCSWEYHWGFIGANYSDLLVSEPWNHG
jgi:hypothetical protein